MYMYMYMYNVHDYMYMYIVNSTTTLHNNNYTVRGMEIVSQLPDILAHFQYCSRPAPHILCIQLSFNLSDIHVHIRVKCSTYSCIVYTCTCTCK